ncbi:MAG: hypothetical protein A2147_10245 [Chloroflexi bacterium RBG_16_57_8]|nr:MAG: hypothetical protein A2147_10245 [Chloroflexi bacterium RBG_16_57_8]
MKPVHEDEYGAYLGIHPALLGRFVPRERSPNFEVYDSLDGSDRLIMAKSSRLPDDEDLNKGKHGIDFNRPKPELHEAFEYAGELPKGYQWLHGAAFAARTEQEYQKKSLVWDSFYSYVWGTPPQTVWVAPHSGSVNRPPDDVLRFPKLMTDNFTAGVAALCALKNGTRPSKRVVIAIHSTGHLGGVLNLGDFGILDEEDMGEIATKMEAKHGERAQALAEAFKRDFCETTMSILEDIQHKRGTLDPEELSRMSYDDSVVVRYYIKGLRLYGQELAEHTLRGFQEAMGGLAEIRVPVITNNYFYTGRNVGRLLRMRERIADGLLGSAVVVECSRLYAAKDPEFVSDVILDVVGELFPC